MLQPFPKVDIAPQHAGANAEIDWLMQFVSEVRSVKADLGIDPARKIEVALANGSAETHGRLARHGSVLERLARLETIDVTDAPLVGTVNIVLGEATLCLKVADVIDLAEETARLTKEIAKLDGEIGGIEKKLSNAAFVAKAPAEVVEEQKERMETAKSTRAKLDSARAQLAKMV